LGLIAVALVAAGERASDEASWDDPLAEIDEQLAELDYLLLGAATAAAVPPAPTREDAAAPSPSKVAFSPWFGVTASAAAGVGYSSNPALAEDAEGSMLAAFDVDVFATWIPHERHLATAFLLAEGRYYTADAVDEHELVVMGQGRWEWSPGLWSWATELNYLFARQFFDASDLVSASGVELLEQQEPQLKLVAERALGRDGWFVRGSVFGARTLHNESEEDYRSGGVELALGRELAPLRSWEVHLRARRLDYDERTQASAAGAPLPGTQLVTDLWRVGVSHGAQLDTAGAWRLRSDVYFEVRDDNGGGFYDQYRWSVRERLSWRHGPLRTTLSAGLLAINYRDRTLSVVTGERVEQWKWDGGLKVEWDITSKWRLQAEYSFGNFDSNTVGEDYEVHSVIGSVGMNF